MRIPRRIIAALAVIAGAASLGGARAEAATMASACAAVQTLTVPAAQISLPTGGARILRASYVAGDPKLGAHCEVIGKIAPVDPKAPPIKFEVNLPDAWNSKVLQYGGGGWNGVLTTGLAPLFDQPPAEVAPLPISLGYVTVGTDSGHADWPYQIPYFARNDEALTNFLYASYKKTRDAALQIVKAYYGRSPNHIYYFGGSQGGREAMAMVEMFPTAYDGVVAIVPAIAITPLTKLGYDQLLQERKDGWSGWLSHENLVALQRASVEACDAADGLKDGVVSIYEGCRGPDLQRLHCPDNVPGPDCLTTAQIAYVELVHRRSPLGFADANGETTFPGWPWGGGEANAGGMVGVMLPPTKPPADDMLRWSTRAGFARYFVTGDPDFSDPIDAALYATKLHELSVAGDMTNPDLSAFMQAGGKLIMVEHGADWYQNPERKYEYYRAVQAKLGADRVHSFMRFYVTPGVVHMGNGRQADGSAVPDRVDLLGPLDDWVSKGVAPGDLVNTSYDGARPLASRPMCQYPDYPRYLGAGDPRQAASFRCTPLPR